MPSPNRFAVQVDGIHRIATGDASKDHGFLYQAAHFRQKTLQNKAFIVGITALIVQESLRTPIIWSVACGLLYTRLKAKFIWGWQVLKKLSKELLHLLYHCLPFILPLSFIYRSNLGAPLRIVHPINARIQNSILYLYMHTFMYVYIYLPESIHIYLFIYLSIHIYLFIYLSIYLSHLISSNLISSNPIQSNLSIYLPL